MKKRIMALLLMGCLALTACGSDKAAEETQAETDAASETEESSETDEIPVTDDTVEDKGIDAFLTLGEYKGIQLEKMVYTVTDEDVENQIATELASYAVELTDPEATVEMGDSVNLDYSGSIDGVAFDGGTAEGQILKIGSGQFIDGFEDQMVGMKVGESGEVHVTFPENYQSEDLQGKDAVFAVTVNAISRAPKELTVEWLQENTEYTTIEEYRESIRTSLEEQSASSTKSALAESAWATVFATASFKQYPQDLLDECYNEQKLSYENYATSYGMEYDEFMESAGVTEDDLMTAAKEGVEMSLVMEYICVKEDMAKGSEAYNEVQQEILEMNGLSSLEEAIDMGVSEWNVDFLVKYDCVMQFIVDNAEITEVPVE